jgi:hypothetical protein
MGRQQKSKTSSEGSQAVNTDQDRFPTVKKALSQVLEDENCPDYPTDLITIRAQASGELVWRIRPARAEETDVGVVS